MSPENEANAKRHQTEQIVFALNSALTILCNPNKIAASYNAEGQITVCCDKSEAAAVKEFSESFVPAARTLVAKAIRHSTEFVVKP